ncbi:4-hydroxybenzoate decarboxylase [Desulfuribacillus stibiiarsenatis]|uniref:4-hydroxybenzoate decarboxylase n=1 Tax=Desulfuribacillus stibiiarsenatis TaxID=1390249 RepID=A0A1E5L9D8_9FIRM|nr:UbiD family decarboxylase [Desulfuribacillus stibiiarsenatis]OEH86609.1 4-hydroxybenzoate decarboxylase [Desulfuribacillus stibiiarsenatis]
MHRNLRTFLDVLKKEQDVVEIDALVDPYLEIPEIHRRVIEDGGPVLLFKNVKGSNFPVVTNLFGTVRRVELAFGPKPEQIVKNLIGAIEKLMPPTVKALWGERELFMDLAKVGSKVKPSGSVLETYHENFDMTTLPALTGWQEDGGPFITLPLVYTEHPETKEHNLGMYRVQIHEAKQVGMHWQIHKGGGFHHHEAEVRNQALPVTLFLGGPPALIISAIAPLPENVPELLFTSFLMGEKLDLTKPNDSYHRLVAEAEFAFSGVVPPHVRRPEGPFGDHYGYYSLQHDFPVFNIERVWHRKDAIFPATIVGKPRQEDYYIGDYLQSLLSPMFPVVMSGVRQLWTYGEAGFHALAGAVVRESYYKEALGHAFRIMGEGQLTLTKFLVVTDANVNLANFKELFEAVLERFHPERDLLIINDSSMDTLDYTGREEINKGSKAIMMGIGQPHRQLAREYNGGTLPGIHDVKVYCRGCLVVSGESFEKNPDLPAILVKEQEKLGNWVTVFIVDDATEVVKDQTSFLWTTFTRFNPASDIFANSVVQHNKIKYSGPIIVDARMKPVYPKEVTPREDIVKLVSDRWKEYGI